MSPVPPCVFCFLPLTLVVVGGCVPWPGDPSSGLCRVDALLLWTVHAWDPSSTCLARQVLAWCAEVVETSPTILLAEADPLDWPQWMYKEKMRKMPRSFKAEQAGMVARGELRTKNLAQRRLFSRLRRGPW